MERQWSAAIVLDRPPLRPGDAARKPGDALAGPAAEGLRRSNLLGLLRTLRADGYPPAPLRAVPQEGCMVTDLRLGRWQDALADVEMVDAVVTDPPYSERTHEGHSRVLRRDANGELAVLPDGAVMRDIGYASWSPTDVGDFVASWAPRCRGWFAVMTDHVLAPAFEDALKARDRYVFAPLPCVIRGMTVRIVGDGPSSWTIWLVVARPRTREFQSWGTLQGAYGMGRGDRSLASTAETGVTGGKPLALMRAIVRDYSRPGDLVCDPCAGGATTLLAARQEGRRSVGAEMDPETFAKAKRRLAAGYTPDLFAAAEVSP